MSESQWTVTSSVSLKETNLLPDSKYQALNKLEAIESRLEKNSEHTKEYD